MNIVRFGLFGMVFALASSTVACAAQTDGGESRGSQQQPVGPGPAPAPSPTPNPPAPAPECTPIPGPAGGGSGVGGGLANPSATYCVGLGYTMDGEDCVFPDGTKCEEWSFWRGECGQSHSFCNMHGGTVANVTEDVGGATASYAECTLATGQKCHEDTFATTCICE